MYQFLRVFCQFFKNISQMKKIEYQECGTPNNFWLYTIFLINLLIEENWVDVGVDVNINVGMNINIKLYMGVNISVNVIVNVNMSVKMGVSVNISRSRRIWV